MDIRKRTGYNSDYNTIHTANLLQRGDAGLDAIGVASNVVMYGITMLAVIQDLSSMRISNRLILAGIMTGLGFRLWMQGPAAIVPFLVNISFPVIVLYLFFLMGAIGAGDIKLMGVITGFLGVWDGVLVIGFGMVFAAVAASYRMIKQGTVWFRLERAARFAVETGIKGRLTEYPGYSEKEGLLRLGPYLFAGYCLFLLIQ